MNRLARPLNQAVKPTDNPGSKSAAPAIAQASIQPTEIFTYFTIAGETKQLYAASRWTFVRLMLENAGPVSIGTKAQLTPVLSGRGILLVTDEWVEFTLAPGNRLYIAADSLQRVKVVLEPFAWQEQILAAMGGRR